MGYSNDRRFFCLNCGNEGIPLIRKNNHFYGKFHRKKLYCLHCKLEVNHMECRSEEEIQEFKENFANGDYIEEAKESIKVSNGWF